MSHTEVVKEPERTIPVTKKTQVVVAGGGPAGFGATIAAAQNNMDVLLIERYGFLGGVGTGGYSIFLPLITLKLIGGVLSKLVDKALKFGGIIEPSEAEKVMKIDDLSMGMPNTPYDTEVMKFVMNEMVEEMGGKLLLDSLVVDAITEDNKVKGVIIENKSGRMAILADIVIDTTGDGDIIKAAGAPFKKPDKSLPLTLMFRMNNVNTDVLLKARKKDPGLISTLVKKAMDKNDLDLPPAPERFIPGTEKSAPIPLIDVVYPPHPTWYRKGEVLIWGAHAQIDCANAMELSKVEIDTRKQVFEIVRFLKKYVPGFDKSYLQDTAPQIGARESGHIVGEYVLTEDDILTGKKFEDSVVRSACWDRPSVPYYIPHRCLIPQKIKGALAAGKCLSITAKGFLQNSPRDISTCMATGEAAGTAAALAIKNNIDLRNLDVAVLRKTLLQNGARLD